MDDPKRESDVEGCAAMDLLPHLWRAELLL